MNKPRVAPAGRKNRKALRVILTLVVLAMAFSGFQYYQTGRLNWYETPYFAARDFFSSLAAEAPDLDNTDITGTAFTGFVSKVSDGDTLEMRNPPWQSHTIRLYGIDTPEWNQPWGDNASAALRDKVFLRTVTVELRDIDTYGRYVGTVFLEDRNINREMVAEGHAWWYEYYARGEQELREAQDAAREAQEGLWALSNPVAPWDWRRNN